MRANSVVALVQAGNERRDHFLGSTRKVPVGKMQRIRQFEHAFQHVRSLAETLQNVGDAIAVRIRCPPILVQ